MRLLQKQLRSHLGVLDEPSPGNPFDDILDSDIEDAENVNLVLGEDDLDEDIDI